MSKHTVTDNDNGETRVFYAPPVTAEAVAKVFAKLFDRSFELVSWNEDGKVVFQCKDKDSGQEVMSMRDVAIVLGKTQKEVYGMIGNRAKQTASVLGVQPIPVFRIPGSKQYGIIRDDFYAWLRTCPPPIHVHKGRKGKRT
jgi:hypothetical protein